MSVGSVSLSAPGLHPGRGESSALSGSMTRFLDGGLPGPLPVLLLLPVPPDGQIRLGAGTARGPTASQHPAEGTGVQCLPTAAGIVKSPSRAAPRVDLPDHDGFRCLRLCGIQAINALGLPYKK